MKKIIHADVDLANCSNNAAFAIAVATEQFLQYLVEQTHQVARADRKPRRNIQYKDVANAVARHDNLEFLTDVVPRTTTYKAHKEKTSNKVLAVDELTNGAPAQEGPSEARQPSEKPDHAGPEVMDLDVVMATDTNIAEAPSTGPSAMAEAGGSSALTAGSSSLGQTVPSVHGSSVDLTHPLADVNKLT